MPWRNALSLAEEDMAMPEDDLIHQLAQVRAVRRTARRRVPGRSRLDRYRADIEALAGAGASSYEIALWLRQYKRTRVHPTTVWRALRRWRHGKP